MGMRIRESEVAKVNSSEIKKLESTLSQIDQYENELSASFDKYIEIILGDITKDILAIVQTMPNIDRYECNRIRINGTEYKVPKNFLKIFHKSQITDPKLKIEYELRVKKWFESKSQQIEGAIANKDSYDDVEKMLPPAYALASLALTTFHKKPNMILHDVQKMTGIAIAEGKIAELGTGEGKTLAAVLPTYLMALRRKGAHVITANSYLAKRDYEETLPIYDGLGLSSGFVPDNIEGLAEIKGKDPNNLTASEIVELEEELKGMKQKAYQSDITYGSKQTFAFDYLRDNSITKKSDMLQRPEKPGFALIDEVDDALIDDAQVPYRIATVMPMYHQNMSLNELCAMLNISYEFVASKATKLGISTDSLTYEEARYVANTFAGQELMPDQEKFQELAQRFFSYQKVLTVEDNTYGFRTGRELFEAISDEEKYDSELLRKTYGIIYCRELHKYKISDKCFEDFLKQAYFSFQINSQILDNQEKIKNDKNYEEGKDYYFTNGKMKLTLQGANKILNDDNYPEFIDNYNRYLSLVSSESSIMVHYFNQAVVANLMMKQGEDYIVEDGRVKTLKNGRVQEGSTYSNGLHQAIEIKENIPSGNRTKETTALATVTQKDFYSRYDMFSGMTGTSSKKVFSEIFGKETLELPKHAFYSFYGNRKVPGAKEPNGVLKNDTQFTLNVDDKINLIVNSIKQSQSVSPKQPVLLVVSNVDEIEKLSAALEASGIAFNVLYATDSKENEALKIAKAGLPGAVTISTEMAGRGTDIRVGGDRDTIIDIATERFIRAVEKKNGVVLNLSVAEKEAVREKVEKSLMASAKHTLWTKEQELNQKNALENTGLKVISSGYFKMSRIDRQLEGRTGRNGISGVCERFACPDDIKAIGVTSFNGKDSVADTFGRFIRRPDGSLNINDHDYKHITEKIETVQDNFENGIKSGIKQTQELDSEATKLVESYRNQRRKIVCDELETDPLVKKMIENAVDGIMSSYIANKKIDKKKLSLPILQNDLGVDVEAISLEVKQMLGVTFDPNVVIKTNMNLLELRDAIIRTAKDRYRNTKADGKKALLAENDFMIANIPVLLEHSFTVKRLTSMSLGMEGQAVANANIAFAKTEERLHLEACKEGTRSVIGIPLNKKEFKRLEMKKSKLNEYTIYRSKEKKEEYELEEPKYKRNNESLIERFKRIKEKLAASDERRLASAEKKLENSDPKEIDIQKIYSKVKVRPLKFMNVVVNGKTITKLVLVKNKPQKKERRPQVK